MLVNSYFPLGWMGVVRVWMIFPAAVSYRKRVATVPSGMAPPEETVTVPLIVATLGWAVGLPSAKGVVASVAAGVVSALGWAVGLPPAGGVVDSVVVTTGWMVGTDVGVAEGTGVWLAKTIVDREVGDA
jgi:hypothetical protein